MGWQMLDRMDMDTVWLNLLLLSYATATHRRGERPVIRIGRRTVEKVFGYTNGNYTVEERAKKIQRHVEALQSIFVQLQNVQRHGDKLHFRGDMAGGAPLWSLRMVAEGEKDLFSGETVADWYLEAREGMWATEFLHNHGNQFTPLPKDWFQQIDRRGSRNYAQRLAVYLLFQFRINSENDARVTCKAETLLNVCGEDLSAERDRHRRSELKQCLSNALDTLARDYGIKVHARQIHKDHTSGMDFNTWRNRKAVFDPPAEIEGRIFKQGDQSAPLLPEVAGDWRPDQIRHLRKEILGEAQSDFGDRLGVSKQYVSQMERGVDAPSTKIRKRLDGLQTRHA
jgi:DNA-binding XRE family transcriptional regulator